MAEEFKPQYNFTDDRLNELKQLFPEAWEDGVFNVDTLRSLIGDYNTDNSVKEHFGLNWVGKQDARKIASKPPTGTLKPAPGEGVNEENTENIFIEGDNLEVLKILRKSYMGKIKMIYIDPPYNTGNDFIYNDSFGDSTEDYLRKSGDKSEEGLLVSNPITSGKFHANWLSFMYPRLKLAKELLKDEGSIFVSIGVEELSNLKSILDEVFGEENFVEVFSWVKTSTPPALATKSRKTNEYVLCYEKNKGSFKYNGVPLEGGDQPLLNRGNSARKLRFPNEKVLFKFGGKHFSGQIEKGAIDRVELLQDLTIENGYSTRDFELKGEFKWTQEFLNQELEKNTTFLIKSVNLSIRFIRDEEGYKRPTNFIKNKIITPLIDKKNSGVDTNEAGSSELEKLFKLKVFDFPKPTSLLKYLMNFNTQDGDYILDFFAGSNSTGSAVVQLCNEGKKLKYMGVQIPEPITDKTITGKNAIQYLAKKELALNVANLSIERMKQEIILTNSKVGFKVYILGKSSIYKWKNFESQNEGLLPDLFSKLEASFKNPLVEGTTPEEFIAEVMLQEGFPLTANQTEVQDGIFEISHDWVPYTLYVSMLQSFKNIDLEALGLSETDHFVCLDMAFENNDALKQTLDNHCKLFTV